jgi:hypothetical protein
MASSISDQGFFTSGGVLRSESPATNSDTTAQTQTSDQTTDIADQVASDTVSAITEAAVVKISNQMNVAGTGFDSGVSDMVGQAVTSALGKLSEAQQATSALQTTPLAVGGTYQNEILYGTKTTQPSDTTQAPKDTPNDTAQGPKDKPKDKQAEITALAEKYVAKREEQMQRKLSNEERQKAVSDIANFYSDPNRQGRLKKLVDEEA